MKAKHIFTRLNYRELNSLLKEFPELQFVKIGKFGGGGWRWRTIPPQMKNKLARHLRECFRNFP